MDQDKAQDKRLEEKKQTLLFKMGLAESMASHSQAVAGRLKEAADHHHSQAQLDLPALAQQIKARGVGNDPEAEEAYCRRLMERHRMQQTHSLAEQNEQRFPDVTTHEDHMEKSLHRLPPDHVARPYEKGELVGAKTGELDDFQPRLYDPKELLPREPERDKHPDKVAYFTDLFTKQTPWDIDPLVLVRTEHGREILDGHHRWHGANAAEKAVLAVEIGQAQFSRLQEHGFSDSDIAYAVLAHGECWDAADKVRSQYDGKSVRRSGFRAYEHLGKGVVDEAGY